MTTTPAVTTKPRLIPRWYFRLVAVIAVATVVLGVLAWKNLSVDSAQNLEQNRLLRCLNDSTAAQSKYSKDVRPFTVAVTLAQTAEKQVQVADSQAERDVLLRQRARGEVLLAISEFSLRPPEEQDVDVAAQLVADLVRTQRALVKAEDQALPLKDALIDAYRESETANDALAKFRADNPVPDPPAVFCADDHGNSAD